MLGCRKFFAAATDPSQNKADCYRLALCEMYVTLGSIFRRFKHLKGNELSEYDLLYDDYFASHRPMDAVKLHIVEQDLKE